MALAGRTADEKMPGQPAADGSPAECSAEEDRHHSPFRCLRHRCQPRLLTTTTSLCFGSRIERWRGIADFSDVLPESCEDQPDWSAMEPLEMNMHELGSVRFTVTYLLLVGSWTSPQCLSGTRRRLASVRRSNATQRRHCETNAPDVLEWSY
jgi:hypothetical protein